MLPGGNDIPGTDRDLAARTSADAAAERGSIVLVPLGAVEQHGPHLPLGTDIWLAHRIALDAAERAEGVLVAEALPVGCSAHHRAFPGTLSLQTSTFVAMVCDVARCLAADGFVPVFVNGHGGNRSPLGTALQTLLAEGIDAWGVNYFELIRDALAEEFDDPHSCGHACAMETSLSRTLWPQLVKDDLVPGPSGQGAFPDASLFGSDPVTRHVPFERLGANGVVGDPSLSSVASGTRLREAAVSRLAELCGRIARAVTDGGEGTRT